MLVHLLFVCPLVLGVAAHKKKPTNDGPGSVAWASQGEQYESMILLDLSAMQSTAFDTPPPQLDAKATTLDDFKLNLTSVEPQPPPELEIDQEEAESADRAAGDPASNAVLFGRYMGQVTARIERAWIKPRSAIEGGRFACRVRVTQNRQGNVQDIALQTCDGDETWRKSLTAAILRASPFSAPPEPWLYTPTLTLNFSGEQYVANRTSEDDYVPVNMRVTINSAAELESKVAPLDGNGDVELTITGSEVRWTRSGASVAKPQ